jgi:hypothetical protein
MFTSPLNAMHAAEMNFLRTVKGCNRREDIRDELQIFSIA